MSTNSIFLDTQSTITNTEKPVNTTAIAFSLAFGSVLMGIFVALLINWCNTGHYWPY